MKQGRKETIIPAVLLYAVHSHSKVKEKLTIRKMSSSTQSLSIRPCFLRLFFKSPLTLNNNNCKQNIIMPFSAHCIHICYIYSSILSCTHVSTHVPATWKYMFISAAERPAVNRFREKIIKNIQLFIYNQNLHLHYSSKGFQLIATFRVEMSESIERLTDIC